jgi:hypothetical protein
MIQVTREVSACQCTISAPPGVAIAVGLREEIDRLVRRNGGWKAVVARAEARKPMPRRLPLEVQPELMDDLPPTRPRTRRKTLA